MTIAIVGSGSWGTTLSLIASKNTDVVLYSRSKEIVDEINRTRQNSKYVKGIELPQSIKITGNPEDVSDSDLVIFAVPSIGFRDAIKQFSFLDPKKPYISVTKGLEQNSNMRMSEVILDTDTRKDIDSIAVLGGPNLAQEIAMGNPAATLVASKSEKLSTAIQKTLMTPSFRVYISDDVVGCEIGGVAKNVVAIAVGIGDGFSFGDNAKAAVMTRALAEIRRLGVALGGKESTFSGLAGIGDLMATCSSPLSRNWSVGYALGQGKTIEEIKSNSHDIAEGLFSAASLENLANKNSVEMPIVFAVSKVIKNGFVTRKDVDELMTRPASKED